MLVRFGVLAGVVAAAIAVYYGRRTMAPPPEEPASVQVTFVNNMADDDVDLFWWDSGAGVERHTARIARDGGQFESETYPDHIWTFRRQDGVLIRSVVVLDGSGSQLWTAVADRRPLDEYSARTGRPWLNIWPRDPVRYHMWGSGPVGRADIVEVGYGHWQGDPNPDWKQLAQTPMAVTITTEAESPRLVSLRGFMSAAECNQFVAEAKDRGGYQRSLTTDQGIVSEARTSSTIWLDTAETPLFEHVSRRMFALMRLDYTPERARRLTESFQLLHYAPGQQYKAHTDWFEVDTEENAHYLQVLKGRNRFATFFLYLSDVDEGGETAFPLAQGFDYDGPTEDACQKGLRMKPKKGDAIIFYSMLPDGNLDPQSLHAGCPVIRGEKYAANIWFWEPTRFGPDP